MGCQELLKVSVPSRDIDESLRLLNSRIDKLEDAQVQNGLLITSHAFMSAEEISQVRNTIAELSSQLQARISEGSSYIARIEELALENGTLRALENQLCDSVDGVVDAAGRAYTSRIRELTLSNEALRVSSQNLSAATSVDELEADEDLRVLSQNFVTDNKDLLMTSQNFAAATSAVELRAKSLNTHQKFSAAAGALRVGSLAAGAAAEQFQLPEPGAAFGLSSVLEMNSGPQTPNIPHQKFSAADVALRVSSLVSGAVAGQVQLPEFGGAFSFSPTLPVLETISLPLTPDILGMGAETQNQHETEKRQTRRLGTWPS